MCSVHMWNVFNAETHLLFTDPHGAKYHKLDHFSNQHQGAAESVD